MDAEGTFTKPSAFVQSVMGRLKQEALTIKSIVGWLGQTFAAVSSEAVAEAERGLAEASLSPQFVNRLTFVMSDQEFSRTASQQADDIRQAASTYLRSYADRVLVSRNQASINIMTERLLKALSVPSIPLPFKRNVVSTLQHILLKDSKSIIRAAFVPNLITVLDGILKKSPPNSQQYEYIVLFGVFMLGFPRYDAMADRLVEGCYRNYCLLVIRIIEELSRRVEESERWQLILDEAMTLMSLIVGRTDATTDRMNFILGEPKLGELLHQLITSISLSKNCFRATYGSIHYSIHTENDTLSNAIDMMRILLCQKLQNHADDITLTAQLQTSTASYVQLLYCQSVEFLRCNKQPNETIIETLSKTAASRSLLNALRSCISFFAQMLKYPWMEPFYRSTEFGGVIDNLILPLLELSQADKELFVEEPEAMLNRYETLLDYHLLPEGRPDSLADEGMAIQLTLSQMIGLMSKHLHGWLPQLTEKMTERLISGEVEFPVRLQIILLLGLLWYPLNGRKDVELVKQYLLKNLPTLNTVTDFLDVKVQNALILLLLSRYVGVLKNPEFNMKAISTLLCVMNNVKLDENQPALSHAALDSLLVLLQMVKTTQFDQRVFLELIKALERLIFREGITLKLYDVLLEIFRERKVTELVHGVFRSEFDEQEDESSSDSGMDAQQESEKPLLLLPTYHTLALSTVKLLIDRVEAELSTDADLPAESKQLIGKCWNIVREVLCHSDETISTREFLQHGSSLVARLYRHMGGLQDYFDEDVLLLNVWMLNRSKTITEDMETLYQYFKNVLHRNNCIFSPALFEMVVLFLRFGWQKIAASVMALQTLLDVCIECVLVMIPDASRDEHSSSKGNSADQSDPCRAVLLLEEILMRCSEQLRQEMWESLTDALYRRLVKHQFIKFSFLKSQQVSKQLSLIACLGLCLLNNPYRTPGCEDSQLIYNKLISEIGCFDVSYAAKLYIFVVCEIVKRYSAIADLEPERLFALFRTMLHLLIICYERQRNRLEQHSLVGQHFSKDEEPELPEIEEEKYEEAVKLLDNEVTRSDEFEYFRGTLEWLRQNSGDCYSRLMSMLSAKDTEQLHRVFGIRRVQTSAREVLRIKRK